MECPEGRLSASDVCDFEYPTFSNILTREQQNVADQVMEEVDRPNLLQLSQHNEQVNACERIDSPSFVEQHQPTVSKTVNTSIANDSVSCLRSLLVGNLTASQHHLERLCRNGHITLPSIKFEQPLDHSDESTLVDDLTFEEQCQHLLPQFDCKSIVSESESSHSTSNSDSIVNQQQSSTSATTATAPTPVNITQISSSRSFSTSSSSSFRPTNFIPIKSIDTTTTSTIHAMDPPVPAVPVVSAALLDTRLRDFQQKAVHAACTYNRQINFQRKEERMCSLDMQTYLFHYPIGLGIENRMLQRNSRRGLCGSNGRYPVALLPGQFQEWYYPYSSEDLKQIPLADARRNDDKSDLILSPPSPTEMMCECEKCSECGSGSEDNVTDKDMMSTSSNSSSESCTDSSDDEQENRSRTPFKKEAMRLELNQASDHHSAPSSETNTPPAERTIVDLKPAVIPVVQIPVSTLLLTKTGVAGQLANKSTSKKTLAQIRTQLQPPQKKQFQIQVQQNALNTNSSVSQSSPSISIMKSKSQTPTTKETKDKSGSQVQKLAQIRKSVQLRTVAPIQTKPVVHSINKVQEISSSSARPSSPSSSSQPSKTIKILDQRTTIPLRLHILKQSDTELSVSLVPPKSSSLLQETQFKPNTSKTIVQESPAQVTIHPLPKTTVESSFCSSPQPVCYLCKRPSLINATNNPLPNDPTEMLIQCSTCSNHIHPFCQDMTAEVVQAARSYPWQCTKCKRCTTCDESVGGNDQVDHQLAVCAKCDRAYHPNCVGFKIPLPNPPSKWICALCAVCAHCGTRDAASGVAEKNGKLGWRLEAVRVITANGVIRRHQLLCVKCFKDRLRTHTHA